MKTFPIFIAICLFAPFFSTTDARTFTNTKGKQVEAELIGVENETAILKLANGRRAKVPLKALSDDDQAYAKKWQEENKGKISESDIRVRIEKNSKRIKSQNSGGGAGGRSGSRTRKKTSTTETTYTCTVENQTQKTLEGIKASYVVYKRISTRGGGDSETMTEEVAGATDVETLLPNGKTTFETQAVECVDSSEKGGRGGSSSRRESIVGFVLTLSAGDKEILKECYPANFLDRLEEEAARQKAKEKQKKDR